MFTLDLLALLVLPPLFLCLLLKFLNWFVKEIDNLDNNLDSEDKKKDDGDFDLI